LQNSYVGKHNVPGVNTQGGPGKTASYSEPGDHKLGVKSERASQHEQSEKRLRGETRQKTTFHTEKKKEKEGHQVKGTNQVVAIYFLSQ